MHYTDQLQSPRLTTRFITTDDLTAWQEYCSDPVATRFTSIPGKSPEELAQFFIDRTLQRYAEWRFGGQVLLSKETGEFIGLCGLLLQDVNGVNEIEIGYHLLPRFWHMGYATEAAQMFRDYGFENYDVDSIVSLIDPDNTASQNVAKRNGMKLTQKEIDFQGSKIDVYRITRQEWEEQKV